MKRTINLRHRFWAIIITYCTSAYHLHLYYLLLLIFLYIIFIANAYPFILFTIAYAYPFILFTIVYAYRFILFFIANAYRFCILLLTLIAFMLFLSIVNAYIFHVHTYCYSLSLYTCYVQMLNVPETPNHNKLSQQLISLRERQECL